MTPPRGSDGPSPGAGLILLGVGAIVAGGGFRSAPAVALGVALVIVPAVVRWLLGRAMRDAVVVREAPAAACEGDVVPVKISIRRTSKLPLFFVRVTDVFTAQTLAPRTLDGPARFDRARVVDLAYDVRVLRARGIHEIGPVTLVASDPFSWFTRVRRVAGPVPFKVYPRLSNPAVPERLVASFADPQHAPRVVRAGDSEDFHAVREFRPGDLLKRIHWPTTARRGFPVVKEYLPAVQREMVVFLDVSRELRFFGAKLKNFESSVRFVASLAARAARAGFRITLRGGSSGAFDVPAATGTGQYRRIVETLLHVRTRVDDAFVDAVARGPGRGARGGVMVVMLHPYLVGDPGLVAQLGRFVRSGARVACVVYPHRAEAYGPVATAWRQAALARLWAMGVELWKDAA